MLLFWKIISSTLSLIKKLVFTIPLTAFILIFLSTVVAAFALLGLLKILLSIIFNPILLVVLVIVVLVSLPKIINTKINF